MTLSMDFFSLGSCLKGKSHMCLNALIPSLCALCAMSFGPNGLLIDNSTLDDAFTIDSFLYYLFAYDDIYAILGFILCRGRKLIRWSTCLYDNAIWVLWTLKPIEAPLLMWSLEEVKKKLCLMAPKVKVALPFELFDAIMTFVISLSLDETHSQPLRAFFDKFLIFKTRDPWLYLKCVQPWHDAMIICANPNPHVTRMLYLFVLSLVCKITLVSKNMIKLSICLSLSGPQSLRWPTVGRYRVDVASFESLALPELQVKEDTDLFIIDEVGKMELFSSSFFPAVLKVLQSNIPLLATIPITKAGRDIPGGICLRDIFYRRRVYGPYIFYAMVKSNVRVAQTWVGIQYRFGSRGRMLHDLSFKDSGVGIPVSSMDMGVETHNNNNNIPSEIPQVRSEEGRVCGSHHYLREVERLFPKDLQLKCRKSRYKEEGNSEEI
ncbi:putative HMG1/2-like protein-like [Capsicum annuum]|nr:putative HMG1/2-like protein-like [Capsicum annuum]